MKARFGAQKSRERESKRKHLLQHVLENAGLVRDCALACVQRLCVGQAGRVLNRINLAAMHCNPNSRKAMNDEA